jgi:phage recombination protein Bet
MTTALATLTNKLASQFDMGDGSGLTDILKATAFKSGTQVSDAQMTALLVVANQYGLNPFTKEIFAFPDKGGIVPVVGVDGWSRIMNNHQQFDGMGMEFKFEDDSCTCIIYRKDRSHPISATEYLGECRRDNSPAWKSHPRRMLRHKAMIQAARLAFGFAGIYDQDEAEHIVDVTQDGSTINGSAKVVETKPERPTLTMDVLIEKHTKDIADGEGVIQKFSTKSKVQNGDGTAQDVINFLSAKYNLPEEVIAEIQSWEQKGGAQ